MEVTVRRGRNQRHILCVIGDLRAKSATVGPRRYRSSTMNTTPPSVIVVAPDSYKGSLSAQRAADAIARGVLRALPTCTVRFFPMADGGEGTLRALLRGGGGLCNVKARNAAGVMHEVPALRNL